MSNIAAMTTGKGICGDFLLFFVFLFVRRRRHVRKTPREDDILPAQKPTYTFFLVTPLITVDDIQISNEYTLWPPDIDIRHEGNDIR